MEVRFKVNRGQNTAYVREELRESLGYEWNFNLDNGVGIVYPVGMHLREAIRRVKLNLQGLELQHEEEVPERIQGFNLDDATKP